MRQCHASGCPRSAASQYSQYCETHRSRLRRHGAPAQSGITKAILQPYVQRVRKRIEANAANPVWDHSRARWKAVVEHAKKVLAIRDTGQAGSRHEREAAAQVIKLAEHVDPAELQETCLAMFVMLILEPRRFVADRAFKIQLTRRARGLTDLNAGSWWDHRAGRVKRAYRDLPPRTAEVLSGWLVEAFGALGVRLGRLEEEQIEAQERARKEFNEAMGALR